MRRWVCPQCGVGVLAPERMRALDTRRFCLDCSRAAPLLVARESPALTAKREAAAAKRAEQAKRDRAAATAKREERRAIGRAWEESVRTHDGVDDRALERLYGLRTPAWLDRARWFVRDAHRRGGGAWCVAYALDWCTRPESDRDLAPPPSEVYAVAEREYGVLPDGSSKKPRRALYAPLVAFLARVRPYHAAIATALRVLDNAHQRVILGVKRKPVIRRVGDALEHLPRELLTATDGPEHPSILETTAGLDPLTRIYPEFLVPWRQA